MVDVRESPTPYDVQVVHDVWVPMADGMRLAGNLYLPTGADGSGQFPAILTMIPYHKDGRGGLGMLDAYHRHFASRGYAVLHLDLRGTGGSEGAPYRTLDVRERADGHQAVEWIARQPWCTGDVGAWGISYGGITAMAIAETAPPHLRCIVPIHAPTDNYESMIVHNGARLMYWPDPHWGGGMAASNLMPPLRQTDGEEWLRRWRERLEAEPWIFDWYGAPSEPEHWLRQRVDASKIAAPAYVICGWQDAYPDSVHRLWPLLRGPKRLLLGPWKHVMPERSVRQPVDLVAEIDRWWDRWLKGIRNGVDEEPPVTIYVQGRETWRSEEEWPPARASARTFYLAGPAGAAELAESPAEVVDWDQYDYDARVGLGALPYDACTGPIPYPQDQSFDDVLSLTYTTNPLAEPVEATGEPRVRLAFAADIPPDEIVIVAKLCDVARDGQSFLVTFEHLSGREAKSVGEIDGRPTCIVEFPLRPTSHVFRAGHRIRLSISSGNFPYLWPAARRHCLEMRRGDDASWLRLPIVGEQDSTLPEPRLAPPPTQLADAQSSSVERYWVHREATSRAVSFEGRRENVVQVQPSVKLAIVQHFVMAVDADCPANADTRTTAVWRLDRPTGAVEARVRTVTTAADVCVDAELDLDGHPYFRRQWRKSR